MIKISNTRILHSVENESAYLALRGEVQFIGTRIVSFSGQFRKLGENNEMMANEYCGDFYFSENEEGSTVNKSINSIPTELHTHGCDLMEATVAELKEMAVKAEEPEAEPEQD
jgi:hypothetical protein